MRIDCPFPEWKDSYIETPDTWLGEHAVRRDKALQECDSKKLTNTMTQFSVSLALLENWDLPGLTGPPDKWDFEKLDLKMIIWVTAKVTDEFSKVFIIPKKSSEPSTNG